MAIKFVINGSQTVIPGVYSRLLVENSLPAPAPAGRSVLIIGEAEEGIPGSELNLQLNYFTKFQDVKEFYKSGPIVDAARMLFSNQPGESFPGQIERLYVYKTNASERSEREIASPSNFGSFVAARYGESGNLIKAQICEYQAESKPSKEFLYLPSAAARSFRAIVNGKLYSGLSVAANAVASAFVSAMAAATGLTTSGGADRAVYTGGVGTMDVDLAASGDTLTITRTADDNFDTSAIEVGDVCYIEPGTGLAGAAEANAGAYVVVSVSSTVLVIKKLKSCDGSAEVNKAAFDTSSVAALAEADVKINQPVTCSKTEATPDGMAATFEILEDSADVLGLGMLVEYSALSNLFADATSSIANIEASVPAAGQLKIDINTGTWLSSPEVGDLIYIDAESLIAGSTEKNVGFMTVTAVGPQSITAKHLFTGMTTEAVSSVALNGDNDSVQLARSFVSSSVAAQRLDSSTEGMVKVCASNESTGEAAPEVGIGGVPILEIGYYDASATACTLTIDVFRKMTISPTGGSLSDIVINTKKYKTLSELISFLNTKPGVSAKVSNNLYNSLNPARLDMVQAVDIMDGQAVAAYNGRIKKDYTDWLQYFEDNFGLISFREGVMQIKAGLPDVEAAAAFLEGAILGASASSDFQDGLDKGLKIDVRQVVPLISRDSIKDIMDGLTDEGSTYSIDSIHAQVKAHVATASSTDFARERFGILSYDGTFEDSKDKCTAMSYERLQMTFQRHHATDSEGELVKFLPWMSASALAAGRSQATLSTSMLRKPFLLSSVDHTGLDSIYDDSLIQDFDPDDRGQLSEAIVAGLCVFREVAGFGVRMESPDNTTRSRDNDPKAWVYERAAVLFALDEVAQTIRRTLDNFIGARQVDVATSIVRQAIFDIISVFLPGTGNGALEQGVVNDVFKEGKKYKCNVSLKPTEALEAITIDILSTRDL